MAERRITLEDDVVRWLRAEAERRDTTVPALVRGLLRERMEFELGYEAAMRRYLSGVTVTGGTSRPGSSTATYQPPPSPLIDR